MEGDIVVVSNPSPPISRFRYDPHTNRYRDTVRGVFVAPQSVRRAIDGMIDTETEKARALSQQLRDGQISLAHWQTEMTGLLKHLHTAMGLAACGGIKNISASDLGALAQHIKGQYTFLSEMAMQIRNGTQPLNGTLISRTALYTQAARCTYSAMVERQSLNVGYTQARNILGIADHCTGCLDATAAGWQPIGTLTPIGERDCLSHCKCSFQYRR